jgi:hypothetical protein
MEPMEPARPASRTPVIAGVILAILAALGILFMWPAW